MAWDERRRTGFHTDIDINLRLDDVSSAFFSPKEPTNKIIKYIPFVTSKTLTTFLSTSLDKSKKIDYYFSVILKII